MHFAGSVVVPESVEDPLKYYRNNTVKSRALIESAVKGGVRALHLLLDRGDLRHSRRRCRCAEDAPTEPINPYGWSKLMTERMLKDGAAAYPLNLLRAALFQRRRRRPAGPVGPVDQRARPI